jgi:hypothetical protein
MLLTYSYFLNKNNSKSISCGVNTETFFSNVVLSKNNKTQIIFTQPQWQEIHMFVQNNICTNEKVQIYENLYINIKNDNIILLNQRKKIILSIEEWRNLDLTFEYFNYVLIINNQYQTQLKEYFEQYVMKCVENQVSFLNSNFFFIPSENIQINFSRLFYEIPIECKNKLEKSIFDKTNFYINSA